MLIILMSGMVGFATIYLRCRRTRQVMLAGIPIPP